MTVIKARVHITLKSGVLDPQGKAIEGALGGLGFGGIDSVRQGKYLEIGLDAETADEARRALDEMCRKLLANPVIEDYRIDIDQA